MIKKLIKNIWELLIEIGESRRRMLAKHGHQNFYY